MSVAREVGRALAQAREAAGLDRRTVADRLGMNREVLARVERGDVNSTCSRLDRIAAAYGVSLVVSWMVPTDE